MLQSMSIRKRRFTSEASLAVGLCGFIATKERVVSGCFARLIAISQVIGGFTCERDDN